MQIHRGYLFGRLRKKWVGIRTDEVFFRDTAHGFLAWALATVFMVALFSIVASTATAMGDGATVAPTAEARKRRQLFFVHRAFVFSRRLHCKRLGGVGWNRSGRNLSRRALSKIAGGLGASRCPPMAPKR
jgi:hypothetical protein